MEVRKNRLKQPVNSEKKEEIFRELLLHKKSVFLICMGYTHNTDDAEELTQDIYVKAWENLDRINTQPMKWWIMTIARNKCIDHFRKTRVRNLFLANQDHRRHHTYTEDTPEKQILFESDKAKLKKCVRALPEKLKSVFILKEYGENSCEEISQLLQIKLGTVYSRLNRSRERVIKLMEALNE